jgi:hypothetical protein
MSERRERSLFSELLNYKSDELMEFSDNEDLCAGAGPSSSVPAAQPTPSLAESFRTARADAAYRNGPPEALAKVRARTSRAMAEAAPRAAGVAKKQVFSALPPRRGLQSCLSLIFFILVLMQARSSTPSQTGAVEKRKAPPRPLPKPAFPDHIPSVMLVLATSGCPDSQKQAWLEPMVRGAPASIKALFGAAGYDPHAQAFSGPVRSWREVIEALKAYIARHPSRPSSNTQADKVGRSQALSFFSFLFLLHVLFIISDTAGRRSQQRRVAPRRDSPGRPLPPARRLLNLGLTTTRLASSLPFSLPSLAGGSARVLQPPCGPCAAARASSFRAVISALRLRLAGSRGWSWP